MSAVNPPIPLPVSAGGTQSEPGATLYTSSILPNMQPVSTGGCCFYLLTQGPPLSVCPHSRCAQIQVRSHQVHTAQSDQPGPDPSVLVATDCMTTPVHHLT